MRGNDITYFLDELLKDGLEVHFSRPRCAYEAARPIEVKVVKFEGPQVSSFSKRLFLSDMEDAVGGPDNYLRNVLRELSWRFKV